MSATPGTTSHVSSDLPLHAPKPSLSQSDAKARIQGVTRTDSDKPSTASARHVSTDIDPTHRGFKSTSSLNLGRASSAASTERPDSVQTDEHGIPLIGVQVPMYPNAGDVQAPSPSVHGSSHQPPHSAGLSGDRSRNHGRRHSGQQVFHGPPGSYGLHGHAGQHVPDKFEKAWYDKHPEALAQGGQYSPALNNLRGEYVLSSEDLNRLVHDTAKRGSGFGTAPNVVGLPDEQIGYIASEEYASRLASRPTSSYAGKAHGNYSQTQLDSTPCKASFLADVAEKPSIGQSQENTPLSNTASKAEEEPRVIHVDAPEHRINKVTGDGVETPTIDLGPRGGNTEDEGGFFDEQGYGVPILASDEIRPGSGWQKPAVSPVLEERRASMHDVAGRVGSRPTSAASSRPTSRPGSIHGHHGLSRFISHEDHEIHTPLEDVEEYEPLFEEDEKTIKKPMNEAERLKHRPDVRRRFPSQDIWEDTPNSLQLQAEIESLPPAEQQLPETEPTFEPPELEAARKGEVSEQERAKLIPVEERLEKSNFKPHLTRPKQHRFPSQDIWEDSPDSARLETTVGEEPSEDAGLAAGAVVQTDVLPSEVERTGVTAGAPAIPSRPAKSKGPAPSQHPTIPTRPQRIHAPSPHEHSRLSEVFTASDQDKEGDTEVPAAEQKASPSEERKVPTIPPRPSQKSASGEFDGSSDKVRNTVSSPIPTKAKPPVPSRPVGNKIAAMQAGFMSDLNARLKLGPQAPTKPEDQATAEEKQEEEEKAPLSDARKGRARGPARRKPAASPSATTAETETKPAAPTLLVSEPISLWEIDQTGGFNPIHALQSIVRSTDSAVEKPLSLPPVERASDIVVQNTKPDVVEAKGVAGLDAISQNITSTAVPTMPADPTNESKAETSPISTSTSTAPSRISESTTQTGEKNITVNPMSGHPQKLTVIEGGDAQTGASVVIPKDEEVKAE